MRQTINGSQITNKNNKTLKNVNIQYTNSFVSLQTIICHYVDMKFDFEWSGKPYMFVRINDVYFNFSRNNFYPEDLTQSLRIYNRQCDLLKCVTLKK